MSITQIKSFGGKMLHPSIDIKYDCLMLGFRYKPNHQEYKDLFLFVCDGNIQVIEENHFTYNDQNYYLEKNKRKLMRIDERWNLDDLNKFIEDYANLKSDVLKPKELFVKIKTLAKKYIELEQEIDYSLLAVWSIGTYFFPIFSAYSFLNIKAPKRSGKSQCLNFLQQVCFNAIKARPSLAALGDTVDALRGTYLIDQADSLSRKGGEDLLDILTDSYKKSGGKRRVVNFDKGKGSRDVLEFETYCPKVFASITELPEDLRDRCLIIPLIRSTRNFFDPDEENENWSKIRGEIYKFLIENYINITTEYGARKIGYRAKPDISGRELELWLPFEVIFNCLNNKEEIDEAKKRFFSWYGLAEYEPNELEEEMIKVLLSCFQEAAEIKLSPIEIAKKIKTELFGQDTLKQRAAQIGLAIRKFNLSSIKLPRTKNGVVYQFNKQKVENIYKSYFKIDNHTPHTPNNDDLQNNGAIIV